MQSKKLDEELHKPIFKKIKKKQYIDHILDPDLTDMQLISKVNKGS